MKNSIRVAICVMLVVAVLAMSLSVLAVDEGDRIVAQEYLWAYYIYVFLDSIGIDVTYQGVIEYTDQVQDTIIDWAINYIADMIEADSQPSNYSIAQWIAPWQANYDYWGNLQYNSTMLEDLQDFAEWLKSELSLVDNSTIVINPVFDVDGYTYYREGIFYPTVEVGNYVAIKFANNATTNTLMGYFIINNLTVPETNPSGKYNAVLIALNPTGNMQYQIIGLDNNGQEQFAGSGMTVVTVTNDNGFHYGVPYQALPIRPEGLYFEYSTQSERDAFLENFQIRQQGDVEVVTANIVLPIENPDYTAGEGVTIVDGVPEYSVINIDNVTVDNLPAIVSTGTVSNPSLETFWGFIPVLAEQTKDAIVLTRGLIYELPEEVVVTFYAVMGGLILFGIIKIMREH